MHQDCEMSNSARPSFNLLMMSQTSSLKCSFAADRVVVVLEGVYVYGRCECCFRIWWSDVCLWYRPSLLISGWITASLENVQKQNGDFYGVCTTWEWDTSAPVKLNCGFCPGLLHSCLVNMTVRVTLSCKLTSYTIIDQEIMKQPWHHHLLCTTVRCSKVFLYCLFGFVFHFCTYIFLILFVYTVNMKSCVIFIQDNHTVMSLKYHRR